MYQNGEAGVMFVTRRESRQASGYHLKMEGPLENARGTRCGDEEGRSDTSDSKAKKERNANKDNNVNSRKCSDCQCVVNTQRSRR